MSAGSLGISRTLLGAVTFIRGSQGIRRFGLAFSAGALSMLAFAPFYLSPILLLTLPALVWLSQPPEPESGPIGSQQASSLIAVKLSFSRANLRRGLATGWWFGFGFHLAGLYWIGGAFLVQADDFAWLLPFAVTIMPAGLAIFHGLAIAMVACCRGGVVGRIIALGLALSASEWLRGHILTGFPWNVLGYALTQPLVLLQSASVLGIYGLTLLCVLVFTAPLVLCAQALADQLGRRHLVAGVLMTLAPLLAMLAFGIYALALSRPGNVPDVMLRLVQPSIKQRDKFDAAKRQEIFERHLALSRSGPAATAASEGFKNVTHVIWPEAALAFLAMRSPEVLTAIAREFPDNVMLLAGTLRLEGDLIRDGRQLKVFNSAMVVRGDGTVIDTYDKLHLVPFGEYLPLQSFLEAIGLEQLTRVRGGFAAGSPARTMLDIPGLPSARVLICYEVIFPGEIALQPDRNAALINLTNDAWYGRTAGPYQHFQQSLVRAVEQGLPLVRVGNNGISAVVDPRGRVLAAMQLGHVGAIDTQLPHAIEPTIYARYGDLVFGGIMIILTMMIIIPGCGKQKL